jgi:hypothetical protein
MSKTIFDVSGKANDLLSVSNDGSMKMTRLFVLGDGLDVENDEVVDLCVTSTNPNLSHPLFDQLIGNEIRITVSVEDK